MTDNYTTKTNYKVKNFADGHFAKEIAKRVAEAKKDNINKNIERNYSNNIDIEFWRIKIPKDLLLYYLGNNRTGSLCKDFIKRKNAEGNNLPEDYFDIKNMSRVDVQQDYHEIIFNEANHEIIAEQYQLQGEQLDEIYITAEGVVVNGNSRLSTIREKLNWAEVECYVYPDIYSNKWEIIESHTSQRDNKVNFAQEDPWYSKAHTYEKYFALGRDPVQIAELMNYSKGSDKKKIQDMEADVQMCLLAQEFLDSDKFDKYEYLIDLKKLGSDSGLQVFKTMSGRLQSLSKGILPPQFKLEVKNLCFGIISTGNKGAAKSLHEAISLVLGDNNVRALVQKKIQKNSKKEDSSKKPKRSKKDEIDKSVDDAIINKKIASENEKRLKFKDGATGAERELRIGLALYYDKSATAGIEQFIEKIEALLDAYKEKIKNHKP